MGINFNEITKCVDKCDCDSFGNIILKENQRNNLDTNKKKSKIQKKIFNNE